MGWALGSLFLPALWAFWNLYALIRVRLALRPVPARAAREEWPRISLIVPARNEAKTIERATKAKLESDYPNLEIVLVDDRSTDETGSIIDALAKDDARIRVLHITELPEGWLGKVHALHRGTEIATGEWLLFCDADVHMGRTLLRRVIAHAEDKSIDFMGLMPHLWAATLPLDIVIASLSRAMLVSSRLWKMGDPKSSAVLGNGTFVLARRSVYAKTPGFEWLRLEVLDDQVFAQMMKRNGGAKCDVLDPGTDLGLRFYDSLGEMMRGLEKNGYVLIGQLRPERAIVSLLLLAYVELGPAIALACESLRLPAAILTAMFVFVQVGIALVSRRSIVPALVPFFGTMLFLFVLLRSVVLTHVRGGISWRGTFYSLADLRKGSRLEVF